MVEPSTGTLVAVSQPSVDTHQHDSYDLNLAVNSTYAPVAAATEAYGDLTDGEEARAFEVTADGVIYVVNTRLLTGHTGSGWLVFEVTDAVESNDCTCAGGQSEMYSNCTCYTEVCVSTTTTTNAILHVKSCLSSRISFTFLE